MAIIRGLAFTPDGKQLVSAGEDKVIRVWDLASGRTVRAIRGESAAGSLGKILAMTLSPDGKWLAVAGDLKTSTGSQGSEETQAIRLFHFESGKTRCLDLPRFRGEVRCWVSLTDVRLRRPPCRCSSLVRPLMGLAGRGW